MECAHPMTIPRPGGKGTHDLITVPCGNCGQCLSNRKNAWVIRLKEEWRSSLTSYFITFTYNEHNLPKKSFFIGDNEKITFSVLNKEDIQLFMKRLRKRQEKEATRSMTEYMKNIKVNEWKPIKYFIVGEYGPKTYRPHYHGLLFNVYPELVRVLERRKSERLNVETGEIETFPEVKCELTDIWNKGYTDIGSVSLDSIRYVMKYFLTRISEDPMMQTLHEISPQFSLMSRGGKNGKGVGYSYLDRIGDFHINDPTQFNYVSDGFIQNLPRYYREKIYTDGDRQRNQERQQKLYFEKERKLIDKKGKKYIYQKAVALEKQSQLILKNAIKGKSL
jgi:hypothetical protein